MIVYLRRGRLWPITAADVQDSRSSLGFFARRVAVQNTAVKSLPGIRTANSMIKYKTGFDYSVPIYTDNRRFREQIPAVTKHFEEAEREMEQFPRKNGVIVDPAIVEVVNCPVCDSSKSDQLFVKFGIIYAECNLCSNVFARNRLRHEIILGLYEKSQVDKFDREAQKSPQHNEYYSKIYEKYLSYLDGLGLDNPNLLDIGCGAGEFLKFCAERTTLKLHASDFCEDSIQYIQSLTGKENYYHKQMVEDIEFGPKKFGLVTLWGVLEHVPNPREVLEKCASILSPKGCILILIPNIWSRAFKILGIHTPTLNPRAHLNFYNRRSLEYLCRLTGLEFTGYFQELPVIDLMYPHIEFNPELVADIVRKQEGYYYICIFRKEQVTASLAEVK
jgi:2-polyprenyl-3-methyl-5-hydroxy-6-metoxy-1,4-benzoquinol methylase